MVNDGVTVDVSQNEIKRNVGLDSNEMNFKKSSSMVITKEYPKASQALTQEMKVVENKKLGGMIESNL